VLISEVENNIAKRPLPTLLLTFASS